MALNMTGVLFVMVHCHVMANRQPTRHPILERDAPIGVAPCTGSVADSDRSTGASAPDDVSR
jgi:hypothetical protein